MILTLLLAAARPTERAVPERDVPIVDVHGKPADIAWPPNLGVLKAFERCWGRPLAKAYGSPDCRNPDG